MVYMRLKVNSSEVNIKQECGASCVWLMNHWILGRIGLIFNSILGEGAKVIFCNESLIFAGEQTRRAWDEWAELVFWPQLVIDAERWLLSAIQLVGSVG